MQRRRLLSVSSSRYLDHCHHIQSRSCWTKASPSLCSIGRSISRRRSFSVRLWKTRKGRYSNDHRIPCCPRDKPSPFLPGDSGECVRFMVIASFTDLDLCSQAKRDVEDFVRQSAEPAHLCHLGSGLPESTRQVHVRRARLALNVDPWLVTIRVIEATRREEGSLGRRRSSLPLDINSSRARRLIQC
jgi:hypothetical protein